MCERDKLCNLKNSLQTPLQRAHWALSEAPDFPAEVNDIAYVRSMRSARETAEQPLDQITLRDGRRFVLKTWCEASEIRATQVAAELGVAPPTWAVRPRAMLQEFLPQTALGQQWWASGRGEQIGTSVAATLKVLHSAGMCYVDSMARHLFSRAPNSWYLIDYGTALLLNDQQGPHSEVDQWLQTSPQSRARAAGATGSLAHRGMLHDWLLWQEELRKARLPLMWPGERQACVAAFEAYYPCPPLHASVS